MEREMPEGSFRRKAPYVDIDELTDLIIDDILTEELKARSESVWIQSSFADPDREIDTKDTLSDLDVFVVVPGWDLPAADSGMAIVAPQVDVAKAYEESTEEMDWTSKDGIWDSAEDAWEQIPTWAQETLRRSLSYGFYATESEVESGSVRSFDVTIDSRETFERVRKPDAEFCIWRNEP